MVILVSLAFALAGLLMYAFSANVKLVEIGRVTYFAGVLAFLLRFAGTVSFLNK